MTADTPRRRARRQALDSIVTALVFAAAMIAVALVKKLARELGFVEVAEMSQRATMVLTGLFFAFTGNSMPKTLTPLAELTCDAAKLQAFQRFFGWTWALMGLAYALAWIVLPLDVAAPVSVAFVAVAIALIVGRMVQHRFWRGWPLAR